MLRRIHILLYNKRFEVENCIKRNVQVELRFIAVNIKIQITIAAIIQSVDFTTTIHHYTNRTPSAIKLFLASHPFHAANISCTASNFVLAKFRKSYSKGVQGAGGRRRNLGNAQKIFFFVRGLP